MDRIVHRAHEPQLEGATSRTGRLRARFDSVAGVFLGMGRKPEPCAAYLTRAKVKRIAEHRPKTADAGRDY